MLSRMRCREQRSGPGSRIRNDADVVGVVAHTCQVDGRWVLLTLVVAAAAAIRWRRRTPEPPERTSRRTTSPRSIRRTDAGATTATSEVDPIDRIDSIDSVDHVGQGDGVDGPPRWTGRCTRPSSGCGPSTPAAPRRCSTPGCTSWSSVECRFARSVARRAVRWSGWSSPTTPWCCARAPGSVTSGGSAWRCTAAPSGSAATPTRRPAPGWSSGGTPDQHLAAVAVGLDQPD